MRAFQNFMNIESFFSNIESIPFGSKKQNEKANDRISMFCAVSTVKKNTRSNFLKI